VIVDRKESLQEAPRGRLTISKDSKFMNDVEIVFRAINPCLDTRMAYSVFDYSFSNLACSFVRTQGWKRECLVTPFMSLTSK